MNLKCSICTDLIKPDADIRTTQCGHLFHYNCLAQWLGRSPICPQCRRATTERSLLKIYLSAEENAEKLDTGGALQNKIDNLQLQMGLKEKDIKVVTEKYEIARKETDGLREEMETQAHKTRALKERITFLKSKCKDRNKLEEEIIILKGRLRDMERKETVVTASLVQVNDMLKKELIHSNNIRVVQQTDKRLKVAQNLSRNYNKTELSRLNGNYYNRLQQQIEVHKHCESEWQQLKKRIDDLASKSKTESGNPSESPTPIPKLTQLKNESTNRDDNNRSASKVVPEKVRAQSSVVGGGGGGGYSPHLGQYTWPVQQRTSSTSTVTNKQKLLTNYKPLEVPGYCYDHGLGGHADEESIPSPRPQRLNRKRPKPSSTITAAEFRKLATQTKINEFFNVPHRSDD